jgi:hypothetical protein
MVFGKEPDQLNPEEAQPFALWTVAANLDFAEFLRCLADYAESQDSRLAPEVRRQRSDEYQRRIERILARAGGPNFTLPKGRHKANYDRDRKICELRENKHLTYGQIAPQVGMTAQAVRRAYLRFSHDRPETVQILESLMRRLQEAQQSTETKNKAEETPQPDRSPT